MVKEVVKKTGSFYSKYVCKECGQRYSGVGRWDKVTKYCSRRCSGRATGRGRIPWNRTNIYVSCKVCELKFRVTLTTKRLRRTCSKACYKIYRQNFRVEQASNWQGGKVAKNRLIRGRIEYKDWRKSVFERDDYTCQQCNKRGVYLNAHHVKPFSKFPELRFDVSNGQTLCRDCHYSVTWGVAV